MKLDFRSKRLVKYLVLLMTHFTGWGLGAISYAYINDPPITVQQTTSFGVMLVITTILVCLYLFSEEEQ